LPDLSCIPDLLRPVPALIAGALRGFVQARDPYEKYYDEFGDPYAMPESEPMPIGVYVVGFVIGVGINLLFAFWGKSRADKFNVDPWIGFALGFVLQFIGVAIVPVFRKDRVLNTAKLAPRPEVMNAPNPMYAPSVQAYPPPQGPYPTPPTPAFYPHVGPQPAAYPLPPVQAHVPTQQPPAPPPQMLVADENGYVNCPSCGSRTKSGRKACMTCGSHLPPVFNPHIK
jgi:hypothetical protein